MTARRRSRVATAAALALLVLPAPAVAQPDAARCEVAPAAAASPAVVPIEVTNDHVFVRVCAAGRPLDFILDTGAPNSFFDLGTARELGIRLGASFTARGAGAGTVAGARLDRTSVALAATGLEHPVAAAIDFSGITPREGRRLHGVLGYDFVARFVVTIDYARGELRLHDRRAFRHDGPGVAVPVTLEGNYPYVDAAIVLADGGTVEGRLLVDVGASQALSLGKPVVDRHRLRERVGPLARRRGGSGVGGATAHDVGRVAALRLGGLEVRSPVVHLHGDSAGVFTERASYVGSIGGDLLRRYIVHLDYARRRILFEPHAGTGEPFEADMSGLGLVAGTELATVIVADVAADTPASAAALAPGDTIVAVDGRPTDARTLDRLRRRFRTDGERVALTVRRDGAERTVTLVLRRVV